MRLDATIGRLKEQMGGVPDHGEFVVARSFDKTSQLTSQAGTRMWHSPDDNLSRVLTEAQSVAKEVGQAVVIIGADPGHWQQFFVVPLFSIGVGGAYDAVTAISQLKLDQLERGRHLFAVADESTSLDLVSMPVADDLLPVRARSRSSLAAS